ncbi:MAG: hypothetical protein FJ106_01460 [Deltaproteobacteria bacterium]|nr:hypothetical protein [Deltaproteobacteria bacterium]
MKKTSYFLTLLALVVLMVPSLVWSESKRKGNPPVITNSFAVEKGYYGYAWKIYIEAEDPDGDMSRIATVVHQTGYGHYPTDWIMLKSPYRKHLKGYVQWNTYSRRTAYLREWTNITLTITIFDKAGHESNEVVFPFEFVSGAPQKINPPAPFNEEGLPKLGNIHIDLFEPTLMGADVQRDL